jgi:hypothetical protein
VIAADRPREDRVAITHAVIAADRVEIVSTRRAFGRDRAHARAPFANLGPDSSWPLR